MEYLNFTLGKEFYVIPTADIVRVLPQVQLTHVPQCPAYIAGVFKYRDEIRLVIDLSHFVTGQASRNFMSTRIALVKCPLDNGVNVVVGLLLESAIKTIKLDNEGWQANPIKALPGQLVNAIHRDSEQVLQRVTVRELLTREVLDVLNANQ